MIGEQPLKFYSEEVTETKIQLINRLLIINAQKNSIIDIDRKYRKIQKIPILIENTDIYRQKYRY